MKVDIGRWDKNLDLAATYGAAFKDKGVPYLTILDAEGKVLANQETGALEEGDHHDPKKVLELLAKHRAPYLKAAELVSAARKQAVEQKKNLFLVFGAPW